MNHPPQFPPGPHDDHDPTHQHAPLVGLPLINDNHRAALPAIQCGVVTPGRRPSQWVMGELGYGKGFSLKRHSDGKDYR